jgi:hypothetical protein
MPIVESVVDDLKGQLTHKFTYQAFEALVSALRYPTVFYLHPDDWTEAMECSAPPSRRGHDMESEYFFIACTMVRPRAEWYTDFGTPINSLDGNTHRYVDWSKDPQGWRESDA